MDDYIQLSTLNDFIFCPYSIYLHSVYMESDGDLYKAAPQTKGTLAHQGVDEKKGSTRKKDSYTEDTIKQCDAALVTLPDVDEYNQLMGLEGTVAKTYFSAYYQNQDWKGRHPRMKSDVLNVTLDIGYSILFNFMESFIRMFGFDLYVGVYHRLWFKRKSLVCDLMEPFRCIIDHAVLLAFNRKQFSEKDFTQIKQEYHLKYEKCADYYKVFYDELIARKMDIFKFVQQYYRCFMGCKSVKEYPIFEF